MISTLGRQRSTDYSGRQLDLEFLQTTDVLSNHIPLDMSVAKHDTKIISGIQKVVQRYTSLLLTDIESAKFNTHIGGELLTSVRYGRVYNKRQLELIFGVASYNAISLMHADDMNSDLFGSIPDDEKIKSATLLDTVIRLESATAELHISIETMAGERYIFITPVKAIR